MTFILPQILPDFFPPLYFKLFISKNPPFNDDMLMIVAFSPASLDIHQFFCLEVSVLAPSPGHENRGKRGCLPNTASPECEGLGIHHTPEADVAPAHL